MDFLDGLTQALGGAINEIEQILVLILHYIVIAFQFIWQVLQIVAQYIVNAAKAIGNFFSHLWSNFFKGIFTKVFNGLKNVTSWLQSHLKPVINFLKKLQKFVDRYYKQYIAPIIKTIQRVRQFLQVLKLLHINIAVQLDKILGKVQSDIQSVFLEIRGILNTTIDLLNIISDPTKLVRRPTMVLSIRRTINALIRQTTGMPPGFYFPSPKPSAPKGIGFLPANFDASNPDHNPPPSYYLSFDQDNLDFGFLGDGDTIGDGAVDGVPMFDYFDGGAWGEGDCLDAKDCLKQAQLSALRGK